MNTFNKTKMLILISSAFIVLPITSAFSADVIDSTLSDVATNPLIIGAIETPDLTTIEKQEVADHPEQNVERPEQVERPEHVEINQ